MLRITIGTLGVGTGVALLLITAPVFLSVSCAAPSAGGNTNVTARNAQIISSPNPPVGWQKHTVVRVNGAGEPLRLDARFNLVSGPYQRTNMQMPSLVYMPEKKRLLLTAEFGPPRVKTIVITSDDFGATWTPRRWLHTDAAGNPDVDMSVGTTYLGGGLVETSPEEANRIFSRDYGDTWTEIYPVPKNAAGRTLYHWDPLLVDKDKSGKIIRLAEGRWTETGHDRNDPGKKYSQAYIWFSEDVGKTWSEATPVSQWYGVNELALVRAKNGDIIAGCRTDNPVRFTDIQDMWSGVGISISKDNGKTFSEINRLYEYGRHHPSFVVMPNGDIVMVYVVRCGYTNTAEGLWRFGIEAIVSKDNGKTWDLDNKYILAWWTGKCTGANWWWGLPQSTATVLLPDGSLLTTFSTGFRNEPGQPQCIMDTALVKWRLSNKPVGKDKTISQAQWDSDARNKYDVKL
jgi:hypothetical protein